MRMLLPERLPAVGATARLLFASHPRAFVTSAVGLLIEPLLIPRLGIIIRDGSSTILRQEAWVVISTRIMQKIPSVPYSLFENNAFQAR